MASVSSDSGSGTQISAAWFGRVARCRSTQLAHAFSRPPTNHFQNGGSDVSSVVCQYVSQSSRSAYSLKHSGKFSRLKRSNSPGSVPFYEKRMDYQRRGVIFRKEL